MLLQEKLKSYNLILVSQSPRRRDILKSLELDFQSTSVDTDETYPSTLNTKDVAVYIAKQKAEAFRTQLKNNDIAITADTVVILENQILGKPKDTKHAKYMLEQLSGKNQIVVTGVCIFSNTKIQSFSSISEVKFATLSDEEIEHYLNSYKPYDKAGAYGVQEWIGYIGIEKLIGSYYNVMGLPTHALYKALNNFLK